LPAEQVRELQCNQRRDGDRPSSESANEDEQSAPAFAHSRSGRMTADWITGSRTCILCHALSTTPCAGSHLAVFSRTKKPDPVWGPVSVIAGVGAGNIFQRGTCCTPAILGGYRSGATARLDYAKRIRLGQRRYPHDSHAHPQRAGIYGARLWAV